MEMNNIEYTESDIYKKLTDLGCKIEVETEQLRLICGNLTLNFEIRQDKRSFIGFYDIYVEDIKLNHTQITDFNEAVVTCLKYFCKRFHVDRLA